MDQQVKRVKRELVKNGAILDIYTDTMQLPDGKLEEWDFISHRKGAAAVVPVRGDGKILMVRQYRNAIDRMTPVSYTHLDVYKRQGYGRSHRRRCRCPSV